MKTSCYAAAGLVAAARTAQASTPALTAQERITMFNPEDFAFSLGGPEPAAPIDGTETRLAFASQFPVLEGQGISMALVNLDACTINLPHIHPRAAEMLYVIEGHLRSGFVEENGGEGAVITDVQQGDVVFYPQALVHYQQNLGCEPASFLAAFDDEDPGTVTISTNFFELPGEAIQATLNLEHPAVQALVESLPEAPAMARLECLKTCGLIDDDDNLSYDYAADEMH